MCETERLTTGVLQVIDQGLLGMQRRLRRQTNGETAVRQELIAHFEGLNRRRARGIQRRGGVRRFTCSVRVYSFCAS